MGENREKIDYFVDWIGLHPFLWQLEYVYSYVVLVQLLFSIAGDVHSGEQLSFLSDGQTAVN